MDRNNDSQDYDDGDHHYDDYDHDDVHDAAVLGEEQPSKPKSGLPKKSQ